ncbi:HD domain-containing phosphohydrolase [Rubinisphaera sp.]|uniref:HD-GYP domain-containing protein n=1 Tax=Rubinisphaera sp. TaxID=2024857 RepID=UPI000C114F42|nr:HD domain-containing phosphohydrolase [Rubinisphaera sp.]MBV09516.1 hypothetical protein [Rubinisphaera sp.]HCS52116.1 hypothetical protein [Planctomycetaceae bacterium]|tara:strand:- start:7613 stop:8959 length:1347 start_codon:yes stop_codon:yes gene_type:complete
MTSEQSADNPLDTEQFTTISINDLIVGRTNQHAIYDQSGILLLAGNSEITQERKLAILQRGCLEIRVNCLDSKRISFNRELLQRNYALLELDTEVTRKLDAIIEGGLFEFKNEGPAVKQTLLDAGRKGYDKAQREEVIKQHLQNGQELEEMISGVIHGETINGARVSRMATQYLEAMTKDVGNVLSSIIHQFSDDEIASRSIEVALMAMSIGIEMNLDARNARLLAIAGLVHDWGMTKVPQQIRTATKRLNESEMLEIKKHPIHSLEMIQRVSGMPKVISLIAYQVHERMNGMGYPRGRKGKSIHPLARILQVADAFVGMTSTRPYRAPMMRYAAMECLIRQARENFVDAEVVRAFLKVQSLFPIGSYVLLSDDSVAQVIRRNQDFYTQPIVMRVQDASGELVDQEADINLIDLHAEDKMNIVRALPNPGTNETNYSEDKYYSKLIVN